MPSSRVRVRRCRDGSGYTGSTGSPFFALIADAGPDGTPTNPQARGRVCTAPADPHPRAPLHANTNTAITSPRSLTQRRCTAFYPDAWVGASPGLVTTGSWVHLAFSITAPTGAGTTAFRNGAVFGAAVPGAFFPVSGTVKVDLSSPEGTTWAGADELFGAWQMYSFALAASDVSRLYAGVNAPSPPPSPPPVPPPPTVVGLVPSSVICNVDDSMLAVYNPPSTCMGLIGTNDIGVNDGPLWKCAPGCFRD